MIAPSCGSLPFSRFPPEIRILVWSTALPEADGPVLLPYRRGLWRPRYLTENDEGYDAAATDNVNLEFCHDFLDRVHVRIPLLYVNREARDVALAWIQREAKATEVRYREDGTDRVFGRTFEAQRDALYVETETLNDFYSEPYDRLFEPDLAQRMVSSGPGITRLAVSESTFRSENSALTDMFDWYSGVAEIFVVVGTQPRWEHNSRKVQRRWTLKDAPGCPLVWNLAQQSFEAPSPESSSPESNTWMADVCRGWTERLVWHQVETLGVRKAYAVAH